MTVVLKCAAVIFFCEGGILLLDVFLQGLIIIIPWVLFVKTESLLVAQKRINNDLNKKINELNILIVKLWRINLDKVNKPTPITDKDILEAVKYAAIKSHPDNGGKSEDFQKFNKLYKQLKGDNK